MIRFASLHWPFCAIIAGSKPPPPSFFYLAKAMPSCPPAEAADHQLFEINIALTCTAALVHTHTAAAVINYRHIQPVSQSIWEMDSCSLPPSERKGGPLLSCLLPVCTCTTFKQYHSKSDFWAQLVVPLSITKHYHWHWHWPPLLYGCQKSAVEQLLSFDDLLQGNEWVRETSIIIK